jgi:hypothetical protein
MADDDDSTETKRAEDSGPRRRKKRRRKKPLAARPSPPPRDLLDADGRERARFLLDFPEHPELERLTAAFEAGNYALVRREAPKLVERARSPAVRDAASELARRIEPDPLAKYLWAASVALLLFLVVWTYSKHLP